MNISPYDRLVTSCEKLGVLVSRICLLASVAKQRLYLFEDGKSLKACCMSSAKRPPSCEENSFGTPWGLHEVCEKIGESEPLGMVFKGRKSTGLRYWECDSEERKKNLITSRILRLRGLERGINCGGTCDTFDRMVYLHGTNHEDKIGEPASAGCLQVTNDDAVELFGLVPVGAHLLIERSGDA